MEVDSRLRDRRPTCHRKNQTAWRRLSLPLTRLRSWRRQRGLESTLSVLGDRQLEDLGITRGEIPAYARAAPHASRLLGCMLQKLDVLPEATVRRPDIYYALLRSCRTCPNVAECERWIAAGSPSCAYRRFCPNAALIDTLPRSRH